MCEGNAGRLITETSLYKDQAEEAGNALSDSLDSLGCTSMFSASAYYFTNPFRISCQGGTEEVLLQIPSVLNLHCRRNRSHPVRSENNHL